MDIQACLRLAGSVLLLLCAGSSRADIILSPDANYTTDTRRIPIMGASPTSSLTDGSQTVSFSNPLVITTFVPWATPPNVEAANPGNVLLQLSAAPVTLTLSTPVQVFGFELANDAMAALLVTATFRLGTTVVEIDQRMLDSTGSALLFAVAEPTVIDNVVISAPEANIGYGIAQIRYSPNLVPEPASFVLLGLGIVAWMVYGWRKRLA